MSDELVRVIENRRVNREYYKITLRSKRLATRVRPGQFFHLKVSGGFDPFLRRPFSYYRVKKNRVEMLYEVLGRGTGLLAGVRKGDRLQVMGPLGHGFSKNVGKKKRILIGGGVGVPPLVFLAERFGCHRFFIGAKTRREALPLSETRKFRNQIAYSTEDGSYGRKGLITELLEDFLCDKENLPEAYFIQTCGPHRMMERVMEIAGQNGIAGEASWDERMACGVGVCLGCMVLTRQGWIPSCTAGPVFRFDERVSSETGRI